jgi:Beta-L-arabinofuranosidase, GH127
VLFLKPSYYIFIDERHLCLKTMKTTLQNTALLLILALLPLERLSAVEKETSPKATPKPCCSTLLGGEVGAADQASRSRFSSLPYDSTAWIRADLTNEKASEFDDAGWGHKLNRPFKNYSGDISGRFIEIMAMNAANSSAMHPAFKDILDAAKQQQRPGGYYAASGTIDWQKSIDYKDIYKSTMMPALWGNARILCGLVEACRAFPNDAALLETTRKLGDFFVSILPRFTDPSRMSEYTKGDTYAAGYVTCYFPAMEGLVKLQMLTGEKKYLDAAITMAEFYKKFDRLPIDHAHGMLCNQVSLLLLYEVTKDTSYLERVESRWDALVKGGYINPAGGILEKCRTIDKRDEGCAIVDWLRFNLALGRVTGKTRYWAMAERTLHNHFLQNQAPTGGFGHRPALCDATGVVGFKGSIEEAVWCCTFHGQLGFINLRSHLLNRTPTTITSHFSLDFTCTDASGKVISDVQPAAAAGEVLRQRLRLEDSSPVILGVRQPLWSESVTAITADGSALPLVMKDGYCFTANPVSEATFIYGGSLYVEDRLCTRLPNGPVKGQPCVLGYGPKLLAIQGRTAALPAWPTTLEALKAQGIEPFPSAFRSKECSFVFK